MERSYALSSSGREQREGVKWRHRASRNQPSRITAAQISPPFIPARRPPPPPRHAVSHRRGDRRHEPRRLAAAGGVRGGPRRRRRHVRLVGHRALRAADARGRLLQRQPRALAARRGLQVEGTLRYVTLHYIILYCIALYHSLALWRHAAGSKWKVCYVTLHYITASRSGGTATWKGVEGALACRADPACPGNWAASPLRFTTRKVRL